MRLTSATRVGDILRGIRWPADSGQAECLLRALGATEQEAARGMKIYEKARSDRDSAAARRKKRPDWWRRSGYVEQIAGIAPVELLDRDAELAELAAWCAAGDEPYVWWQAPARAGKSALMSWFVLHPPPEVWVVWFFATASLASQSDSAAFTDDLLDQLAAITGDQPPQLASAAGRDRLRRRLLSEAAAKAGAAGCRLVLLVDGLDEDCGSQPGSGVSSIAASLPKRPDNLKVIVAGRPDPPIPADVSHDHPLRTCRIRHLPASPHARREGELADHELDEILARHDGLGFQVLGFVTASGGGLDRDDLHVLTKQPAFRIDQLLSGVFGRTVAVRTDRRTNRRVLLFTHETLLVRAVDRLGPRTLAEFQEHLHTWAEGYRQRRWPGDTPGYLIRGYFRMLVSLGDRSRMIALATDRGRHARMLHLTGGDAGALAELRQTQELLLTASDPDLFALASLSIHRQEIETRTNRIPAGLPALWAALGQPARAEALARSLPSPERRAIALAEVAVALDDHDQATQFLADAELAAREAAGREVQLTALAAVAVRSAKAGREEHAFRLMAAADEIIQSSAAISAWSLTEFVEAAARVGAFDRAERAARTIADPVRRAESLALIAAALARAGDRARSLPIIVEVDESARDPLGRLCLVKAAAAAGDLERADRIIAEAERAARESGVPVTALSRVAVAAVGRNDRGRAALLVAQAERHAQSLSGSDDLDEDSLAELVAAAAAAGDPARAERTARKITETRLHGMAWTAVVEALATAGDYDRAERTAHDIADFDWHDAAFSAIARVLVLAGEPERARSVAAHISYPPTASECLIDVARAAVAAGDHGRAELLVADAERMARETIDAHETAETQSEVAQALALAGEHGRAERLARAITELDRRARALIDVANTVMATGDTENATRIATQAVRMLPRLDDPHRPVEVTVDAARALALAGDHEAAEQVAHGIMEPQERVLALADVALVSMEAGDLFRAGLLVIHAEVLARDLASSGRPVSALARLTSTMERIGAVDRAARLRSDVADPPRQAPQVEPADPRELAKLFAADTWLEPLPALARLRPDLVVRIADEVFPDAGEHACR